MLERCKNAQERWGGVHSLIDRWLLERCELIETFAELRETTQLKIAEDTLQRFCQLMVDYVSAGHFGVYEQLYNEAREFEDVKAMELAKRIYPRLEHITEALMAFNDRYDNGDCRDAGILQQDLLRVANQLHERFELEDCLIEVLHTAHQNRAAAVI